MSGAVDAKVVQREPFLLGDGDQRDRVTRRGRRDQQVFGTPDARDAVLELGRCRDLEVRLTRRLGECEPPVLPSDRDREAVGFDSRRDVPPVLS
jgi:hypothetical protein